MNKIKKTLLLLLLTFSVIQIKAQINDGVYLSDSCVLYVNGEFQKLQMKHIIFVDKDSMVFLPESTLESFTIETQYDSMVVSNYGKGTSFNRHMYSSKNNLVNSVFVDKIERINTYIYVFRISVLNPEDNLIYVLLLPAHTKKNKRWKRL